MDQFYISYTYTAPSPTPTIPTTTKPIIPPTAFPVLQSQAEKTHLSTLVKSYISSLLIALRLHPAVVSTSISSRVVGDIRNLVRVAHLREEAGRVVKEWTNADCVPRAVEMCTRFRVRIEGGLEGVEFDDILRDVLENVRAPF